MSSKTGIVLLPTVPRVSHGSGAELTAQCHYQQVNGSRTMPPSSTQLPACPPRPRRPHSVPSARGTWFPRPQLAELLVRLVVSHPFPVNPISPASLQGRRVGPFLRLFVFYAPAHN